MNYTCKAGKQFPSLEAAESCSKSDICTENRCPLLDTGVTTTGAKRIPEQAPSEPKTVFTRGEIEKIRDLADSYASSEIDSPASHPQKAKSRGCGFPILLMLGATILGVVIGATSHNWTPLWVFEGIAAVLSIYYSLTEPKK